MQSMNVFMLVFISFQIQTIISAKFQSIIKTPELLFCASSGEISLATIDESYITNKEIQKQTKKLNASKFRSLVNVSCDHGLYYNLNDNYIIGSNKTVIFVSPIDKKFKNPLNVINKKVLLRAKEVQKLSLDWVHDLLYFIDNGEIYVVNVTDSKRRKILNSENKNIYVIDVVVNPIESFIVWIQWDRRTFEFKIVKADQNGSNKKVLVGNGFYGDESRFFQPCCLSVDYDSKRIYFIDNKLKTLESILFDGTERKNLLQSSLFATTKSLDIYGNQVFWSNSGQNVVLSANKYGLNRKISIALSLDSQIESFRVMHSSRQPEADNICASAQCQDLCIPAGSHQYKCVCYTEKQNKHQCQEYHKSFKYLPNNQRDNRVENFSISPKVTEIVITESLTKSYPLYEFKCQSITDEKTNQVIPMEWFTEDDIKFTEKYRESPIAENITSDGNTIVLKVSYPYVKKLKTFKCKSSSANNDSVQEIFQVIVRQLPSNPEIRSQSLSFAGVSKAFMTLQIKYSKVNPPIDKYRLVYKGIFKGAYYQQEYFVDFNAINGSDKNTIYVVKLDVDYASADLMAFKLYAHNEVGWSYPSVQ